MVFNTTTFNNISVISWRSVLLVEETEVLPTKYLFTFAKQFQRRRCLEIDQRRRSLEIDQSITRIACGSHVR
jgi:hypothetical protein